jgi:hypothetical protein
MFTSKYLRKTLMSSVIGFAVLFPAASHAQKIAMAELAGGLILKSSTKVLGSVGMFKEADAINSIFFPDKSGPPAATPAQVEEIMQRVLREQLTQQTKELETFIVKNNFVQLEEKRRALDEAFRTYMSISTGYQDRLEAIRNIRDAIDQLMGSIKALLGNQERRTKVPQLFFELYAMHNALIPLRIAAQAELVLTSNMLYESGQTTGRMVSDGVELVYAANNALADSRDFWEHDYPGHLNESGAVAVSTDKCISAFPGTLIKSLTGDDLFGGSVYSNFGPTDFNNSAAAIQPMNHSLAHTMDVRGIPRALSLGGVQGSKGDQWVVHQVCYNDLTMRYSRAFDIGFENAVANGTIYRWFSPASTGLGLQGKNSQYRILYGGDFDLNHPNGRKFDDICNRDTALMFNPFEFREKKDVPTLIRECASTPTPIANLASYTSVNYWKPVRNHIVEKTGVFVAPTNDQVEGIAVSVDLTDVAPQQRQMVLNNLQVKLVSNAYDKRFGSNNETDVVKNTHFALLAIIDEYMKTRAKRGENIDTRVISMRKNALSNYQYMHCPEKNKYETWTHITASKYEELFGHAELYCQN